MVTAANKLGFPVMVVENATLNHLQGALRYPPNSVRAILVSYLYDLDEKERPHPDSGHWAVVCSYSARNSRIVLLDSATATKKSYSWMDFRERWMDYDLKRKKVGKRGNHFRLIHHWQQQMMMVISKEVDNLPKFKIDSAETFLPS